jgi:hypothetical protein
LIAALLGLYVVPYPVQNEIKSSKFATFFAWPVSDVDAIKISLKLNV